RRDRVRPRQPAAHRLLAGAPGGPVGPGRCRGRARLRPLPRPHHRRAGVVGGRRVHRGLSGRCRGGRAAQPGGGLVNRLQRTLKPYLPSPDGPKVTDGEIAVFIACVLVTTIGLAGDIARHLQQPESLENDFLSGWHLVLYGGVASVGVFIGLGAIRRGPGYVGSVATGTLGFLMLALGGAADAAWHEVFGTEAAIEALVSPPHLLVFAGLAFLLTAPVVVLWKRPVQRLGLVPSIAVVVSVVSVVLVTSLFTGFLSPLSGGLSLQVGYIEPLVGESAEEYDAVRGLGIVVWTSAMLAAAFAVTLMRFRVVPGLVFLGFVGLAVPPLVVSEG